jgi:hypothetical protein
MGFEPVPPIIEIAYRGRDYSTSFKYIDEKYLRHGNMYFSEMQNIISNEDHKEYVIKNALSEIVNKLHKDKIIEIQEISGERDYSGNLAPWENRVNLKLKVYVPE